MRAILIKTSMAAVIAMAVMIALGQQPGLVDDRALLNAGKNADEWITYGHDYAGTHFSPLKQINTSNIGRLGLAWPWETESPANARPAIHPSHSSTPSLPWPRKPGRVNGGRWAGAAPFGIPYPCGLDSEAN
jgi:glucose dehydrogenase